PRTTRPPMRRSWGRGEGEYVPGPDFRHGLQRRGHHDPEREQEDQCGRHHKGVETHASCREARGAAAARRAAGRSGVEFHWLSLRLLRAARKRNGATTMNMVRSSIIAAAAAVPISWRVNR